MYIFKYVSIIRIIFIYFIFIFIHQSCSPIPEPITCPLITSKWLVNQKNLSHHNRSTPPSSEYGGTSDSMQDYLAFTSIATHKRNKILEIMIKNDINQFQMFKSLTVQDLKALGFKIGVISKLRNNVSKYKAHLAKTR
ncbi:uncharacterized protein VP01_5609g1 [Puccinia sorghi]|uniref:SAM domain-containing protein n=1 Tax=Puccinia sorghi TaxID=27349 RepID=A0A0L6UJ29_9BASI|nr:uncharacterized protein VP01_5609g1 [Puccinia sorghi]